MSRRIAVWIALVLALTLAFPLPEISKVVERLTKGFADDETIAALKSAVQLDPSAPAWWAWLGYAHSLRREWNEAEKAYHRAFELKASPSFAWFPPTLPVAWLNGDRVSTHLKIGELMVWQSPTVFCEPNFAADPKHGDRFIRVAFAYGANEKDEIANCLAHWLLQSGDLPKHIVDAPAVFAAALKLLSERLGTPLRFPVKAWLFTNGNGSAFSFAGHTLFYGTIPSDRLAWWLKVAHEAGHHTVPAFGEFDGLHEPYSGGFLGERLFAIWFWDAGRGTRDGNELQQRLDEYLLKVVSAEIVRAQQWLLQSSESAKPPMQVFLGLCVYLERLGGHELLRDVMVNSADDSWNGFRVGLERTLIKRLRTGLKIQLRTPDANTPLSTFDIVALREGLKSRAIQLAWWLPQGEIQCEVEAQGNGVLQVRWGENKIGEWSFKTDEPQKASCTFVNSNSGWQRLRFWWLKGEGKILSVTFLQKGE